MSAGRDSKPERPGANGCKPLLDAATKHLFQNNAFRITGLPVDAHPREISKRADQLKQMVELGMPIATDPFPLKPEPTLHQIRDAVQKLKDPQKRLVEELFWFWPEQFGHGKTDAGLQALAAGNQQGAFQIWTSKATDSPDAVAATHNLAIYWHITALEFELHTATAILDDQRKEQLQNCWHTASNHWKRLATDESLWALISLRARQLDDNRLTDGFIRQMRSSLPEALDKINAELALGYAEGGRTDLATLHIQFIQETNHGTLEKIAENLLTPEVRRLEEQIQRAQNRTKSNPREAADAARELLKQAAHSLALLHLFFDPGNDFCADVSDDVATACNQLQVTYHNDTGDSTTCLEILVAALPLATSIPTRRQIKTNLGTVTLICIPPNLIRLQQATLGPRWKWDKFQSFVPTLDLALADGPASPDMLRLFNLAAEVLRDMSLDALNRFPDSEIALVAHELAARYAQSVQLKEKLSNDEPRFASARAAKPIHAFLNAIRESLDASCAKLAKIQAWLPELDRIVSELSIAAELQDSTASALQEISRKAFEDATDSATALAANQLALQYARDAELKKRLRADKLKFSKTAPESVDLLSKRLQEVPVPQKLAAIETWLEADFPRIEESLPAQSQSRADLGDQAAELLRAVLLEALEAQDRDTALKANRIALTVVRGLRLKNLVLEDHKTLFSTSTGPWADKPKPVSAPAPEPSQEQDKAASKPKATAGQADQIHKRPIINERELISQMLQSIQRSKDSPAARLDRFQRDVIPVIVQAAGVSGFSLTHGYLGAPQSQSIVDLLNHAARVLATISAVAWTDHKDMQTALSAIKLAMWHANDPQLKEQLEDNYITLGKHSLAKEQPPSQPPAPEPPPEPPPKPRRFTLQPAAPPLRPRRTESASTPATTSAASPAQAPAKKPATRPAPVPLKKPPTRPAPVVQESKGASHGFWVLIFALMLIGILGGILKACTALGSP